MRIQRLAVASIVLALASVEAGAQKGGTTEVGVFGQWLRADDAWHTDNGFGLGGRLGVFLNRRWELESALGFSTLTNKPPRASGTSTMETINGQLNFNLPFGLAGRTHDLLLEAGAGVQRFDGHADFSVPLGGGFRFRLTDALNLRLDGIVEYVGNPTAATFDFPLGPGRNDAAARSTNLEIRAGLSWLLGTTHAPPPPPPPAPPPRREPPPPRPEPTPPPARIEPRPNTDSIEAVNRAREALLAPVYFDFDRSELRPDQRAVLDAKLPVLKANPAVRIRIEGNADERGSDEYNLALGMRRAQATRKYLIDNGISADRIDVTSNGEEKPVCQGHDEDCWKQNRRDEFVIVTGGDRLIAPR